MMETITTPTAAPALPGLDQAEADLERLKVLIPELLVALNGLRAHRDTPGARGYLDAACLRRDHPHHDQLVADVHAAATALASWRDRLAPLWHGVCRRPVH
jgi:hypothetical protein